MYAAADVTFLFFIGERRPAGRPAGRSRPRRNDTVAVYKLARWQGSTLICPEASLSSIVRECSLHIGPFGQHVCCQHEVRNICLINIKQEVEELSEVRRQLAKSPADRRSFFLATLTEIPVNWKSAALFRNVEDAATKFWNRVSLESR